MKADFDRSMTVSIIIPMYNASSTLDRALRSAVQQGEEVCEILCLDDGSADNTLQIAQAWARKDLRIRVIPLLHGGASTARNEGIRQARGDGILFLDADDRLLDHAVAALVDKMDISDGSAPDAVLGGILRGTEKPKVSPAKGGDLIPHSLGVRDGLAAPTDRLTLHGWLFRKSVCLENQIFFDPDLRVGEDSDFVLRFLYAAGLAVRFDAPVYRYTILPTSTIHAWKRGLGDSYLVMLEKIGNTPASWEDTWPMFVLTTFLLILTHDLFHPQNPATPSEKRRNAEELRNRTVFARALQTEVWKRMPRSRRLVLQFAKRRQWRLVYTAVRIRQWMNGRKMETE